MKTIPKPIYPKLFFFVGLLLGAGLAFFYATRKTLTNSHYWLQLVLISVTLLSLNLVYERKYRAYTLAVIVMVALGNMLVSFHSFIEPIKTKYMVQTILKFVTYLSPMAFVVGVALLPVRNIMKKTAYAAFGSMLCFVLAVPMQDKTINMIVVGIMSCLLFAAAINNENHKMHLKAAVLFVVLSAALYLMFFPLSVFVKVYSTLFMNWLVQIAAVFLVFVLKNINR